MAVIPVDEIIVNVSNSKKSWRFVHDGTKVLANPFECEGVTETINILLCYDTLKECEDEIKRLNLEYKPDTNG